MLTKNEFREHAMALLDFCRYPAVQYKVRFSLLDTPYEDEELSALRKIFLKSDIVEEMYQTQDVNGGWGRLRTKDYSVKAKIPTSGVGIERCLYIGLTIEDRDILFMANEYLQELLLGRGSEGVFEKMSVQFPGKRQSSVIIWRQSLQIIRSVMKRIGSGCILQEEPMRRATIPMKRIRRHSMRCLGQGRAAWYPCRANYCLSGVRKYRMNWKRPC